MNGRAYDYNLGRFLSVDPIIQSPANSQSMNPYSYIMNNPLAGTDPTGYMATDDLKDRMKEREEQNRDMPNGPEGGNHTVGGSSVYVMYTGVGGAANGADGRRNKSETSEIGSQGADVTDEFISNHVSHFTEKVNPENPHEPIREATNLPEELVDALIKFGATNIGQKVYKQFIEDDAMATFTEVTVATDPDMQVAWRVGFNDDQNEIHYTRDISAWKAAPYTKRPGDEVQSATIGSLIAHEFGHTKSGLAAIGIYNNIYIRRIDEPRASALFENAYREKYNMPIKRTYSVENDVLNFKRDN